MFGYKSTSNCRNKADVLSRARERGNWYSKLPLASIREEASTRIFSRCCPNISNNIINYCTAWRGWNVQQRLNYITSLLCYCILLCAAHVFRLIHVMVVRLPALNVWHHLRYQKSSFPYLALPNQLRKLSLSLRSLLKCLLNVDKVNRE